MRAYRGAAVLISLVLVGNLARADSPALVAVCPVTHHQVNPQVSLDYHGAKLCFCSKECLAKFQADPSKYAVKANYQLAVTGQARQVACPFTGKPLNANIAPITVGGLSIGFCCRACQQTVARADEATRLDLVFGDAFNTGFAVKKK